MRSQKLQDRALLINGDCLEAYQKLIQINMIFTDPPYGHDNNNDDLARRREQALKGQTEERDEARPIQNDDFETANGLFTESLPQWERLLKPGGYVCCCCGGGGGHKGNQFARWTNQLSDIFQFEQAVVWDKGPIGMGWHYRRSYEFVLVAMKKGGKAKWYDESHTVENIIRPGDYGIKKIIPAAKQHPTEKCVELAAHFIKLHTEPGDTVLDPFMGSGSTGVAALSLGRRFIGVELDEHWADYAMKRLQQVIERKRDLPTPSKRVARDTKQLSQKSLWTDR